MSNQIRPVSRAFDADESVVIEIAIESAVSAFTFVVFDADENPISWGSRPKSAGSTRRPAAEHSIRVYDRTSSLSQTENLPEGDYTVRLFDGRPAQADVAGAGQVESFADSATVLDEDAFSVVDIVPTNAGTETGDIGAPLRISLVREGPTETGVRRSAISYQGFLDHLESVDPEELVWPRFGADGYRAVRDAAKDYVTRNSHLQHYLDLFPSGYLEPRVTSATINVAASTGLHSFAAGEGLDRALREIGATLDTQTAFVPGVELIWNYWLEEGMLVQTLNVILARFQNRRLPGRDPLDRFDVTPLLPLRNMLWGFAEDEVHRMTVRRRAVEYEYEYGFPLIGRAIPQTRQLVERRSGFLESFHQVLFLAHQYFKQLDDLTVQADAFPLYRALRDCHIVLSQGTQNQYGEMAVAARAEFLVMQSILAEPQMREFLGGRPMTPYPEPWMDRVDAMKSIQGWTDTSIMNFNDLATIGEQLVLTIRLGNWADTTASGSAASTWAQALRPAIQQYAAAYRTATGVDLAREANAELPSTLLARKLAGNRIRA